MLIEVTEPARERIRSLLDKEDKLDTHALRLKVVGGGCSGLRYELTFDDTQGAGKVTIQTKEKELKVVMDDSAGTITVEVDGSNKIEMSSSGVTVT